MSIIAAGTTTTTALSSTGNTDGTLQFQVNGTTASVTLNALGAIGVGASPNFGTSGQVLTSAGPTAAPTWTSGGSSQWITSGSNIYYDTGDVTIGATSGFGRLHIRSAADVNMFIRNATAAGLAAGNIIENFNNGASTAIPFYVRSSQAIFGSDSGGSFVERMRLDSSGNLGIGTSSPGARLDVIGGAGRIIPSGGSSNSPESGAGTLNVYGATSGITTRTGALRLESFSNMAADAGTGISFSARYLTGSDSSYTFAKIGGYKESSSSGNGRGYLAFATTDDPGNLIERVRIDASGKLTIGTSASSSDRLLVNGPVQFGQSTDTNAYISFLGGNNYLNGSGTIRMQVSSGGVQLTSGATSWASASDERLKDIIEPITGAVEKVNTLRTVMGKYKTDAEGTRRPFLIAQDVIAVLPEAVDSVADTRTGDETEYLSVRYTDTIPLLVAAIKELKTIVDAQAAEIAALKGQA